MRSRLRWIISEADAVLALGLAIAVGVLGLINVTSSELANNAILVTLGVLSVALLRDRRRTMSSERELDASIVTLSDKASKLFERIDAVAPVQQLLIDNRAALRDIAVVKLIRGADVTREHNEARAHTTRWLFKGGTGTFTRAVTLPECIRIARRDRRGLSVRLEILDPTDVEVCERYARFRSSMSQMPDGTGEIWTTERTREESYATILAACYYKATFALLDVQVGLRSTMSSFRYDMSDSRLIITQEDAGRPALVIDRESFLYDSYDTELRTCMEQSRRVPIEQVDRVKISTEPAVEEVRALFEALGIPLGVSNDKIPRIIQKAIHAKNPYQ